MFQYRHIGAEPAGDRSADARVSGLDQKTRLLHQAMLLVIEPMLLLFGVAAGLLARGLELDHPTLAMTALTMPLMALLGMLIGSYDRRALVLYALSIYEGLRLLGYIGVAMLCGLFAFQMTGEVSRLSMISGFGIAAVGVVIIRTGIVHYNRRTTGPLAERLLIIEDEIPAPRSANHRSLALTRAQTGSIGDDPVLRDQLGHVMKGYDRVVVSCPPDRQQDWASALRSVDVQGELLDERAAELGVVGAANVLGRNTLVVSVHPLDLRHRVQKRLFDLVVSAVVLTLASPVFLAIAIAIAIEDGFPVFFSQQRVGQGNRLFKMHKFRSMYKNAADHQGAKLTERVDPRVTRVGRFIRSSSLDELPQLINVMFGQMSIVGPRPHATMAKAGERLYWQVDARYWERHKVKPGLTGLAQIRGFRGSTDHEDNLRDRLNADLEYLAAWSLWRDIKIMLATGRVLVHPQAY